MQIVDHEKLKSVFADAIELRPAERASFIDEACGDDDVLRSEVISLLNAADSDHNLIEDNIFELSKQISDSPAEMTGIQFGNYRIVREIGHGGMGTVFLARRDDGEFDQDVALKIVRQSVADSRIIEHFRRERQILAGLNHPNIAALHDGGISDRGEPFIAMEYVDGLTLTEYASARALSIHDRLLLFLKVCAAVAYAHRNLVVHRDIKPSNIVINSDGEPKLLDFGLAKAFEIDNTNTQTAVLAFTPAYASPEQIGGRAITTSSDIYSLGVVLYELLTGSKPLDLENKSFDEVLQTINASQPVPPSSVVRLAPNIPGRRSLAGDLDNIVLMALRKEPERRYTSVEDLAEDVRRHLSGRPVIARPNTAVYLIGKFFNRHRLGVGAAALIVISLVTGMIFALWQASVARHERDRAEHRFRDIRQLSNSLLFEITPKIERLNGATEARETVVTRALEYLDSLAEESADDAGLQAELAAAYEKVGDLQGNPNRPNLNNLSGAVTSFEKALLIRQRLPQSADNRRLIARNLQSTSLIRTRQSDISGAIRDSELGLTIYGELIAADPGSAELKMSAIEAQIEHAQIYSNNNQYSVAVPLFRKTIDQLAGLDQNSDVVQKLQTRAIFYLSNALSWDGAQSEAEIEMDKAIELADGLAARSPNDSGVLALVWLAYGLASSIYEEASPTRSLHFAERQFAVAEQAVNADKADAQARYNLARTGSRLGFVLTLVGKPREAYMRLTKTEEMFKTLVSDDPKNAMFQRDLATLYVRMGDTSEKANNLQDAMVKYQRSAEIYKQIADLDVRNTLARRDLA
ncbi:MAG TPA: protein kinase, partial [Pyrinomonadaceae bacterium]|nr:protein kinase [Pyrinomonadaceae bacterium]